MHDEICGREISANQIRSEVGIARVVGGTLKELFNVRWSVDTKGLTLSVNWEAIHLDLKTPSQDGPQADKLGAFRVRRTNTAMRVGKR